MGFVLSTGVGRGRERPSRVLHEVVRSQGGCVNGVDPEALTTTTGTDETRDTCGPLLMVSPGWGGPGFFDGSWTDLRSPTPTLCNFPVSTLETLFFVL